MLAFFDRISLSVLVALAVMMALAPFVPEPHLLEKLRMLGAGQLTKPIDVFDLFWHSWPIALVILKIFRLRGTREP